MEITDLSRQVRGKHNLRWIGGLLALAGFIACLLLTLLSVPMFTMVSDSWFLTLRYGVLGFVHSSDLQSWGWYPSGFGWCVGGYYEADFSFAWLPSIRFAAEYWSLKLPVVSLLLGFGVFCRLLYFPERKRRHRLKRGLCLWCGYDLTGNTSGRCPECGREVEDKIRESDPRWDKSFQRPQEQLKKLADEALGEHRAGRTLPLDFHQESESRD